MKSRLVSLAALAIGLFLGAIVFINVLRIGNVDATRWDFSESYVAKEKVLQYLTFIEATEIRSEPVTIDAKDDGRTNSFGKLKEEWFDMNISTVFVVDEPIENENYVGFYVDEILRTPEGRHWFPSSIKKDPDGIVWVLKSSVLYNTAR